MNLRFAYPTSLSAVALMLTLCGSGCGGGGGDGGTATTSAQTTQTTSAAPAPPAPAPLVLPSRDTYLSWTSEEQRVAYRNMDLIFPTRTISKTSTSGARPAFALPSSPVDLSMIRYQYQGVTYSLDDFIANNRVAGLLVLKDGRIAYERYEFGHSAQSKWTSFSVAKSVVSLLVGMAIRDGKIFSVHDLVTLYLPQLRGSAYEGVSIKDLMQMASGVGWNEDYVNPQSDVNRLGPVMRQSGNNGLFAYMAALSRVAPQGQRFNYNTGETHLVGALVATAVGESLSTYLNRKLWSTFAMESDAFWQTGGDNGPETGGCCIGATLRDYGRIGQFVLRNGVLADGTQIIPANWIAESTTSSNAYVGYGYLWWLLGSGNFSAVGIHGQTIQIYAQQGIVIVMQSFWPVASDADLSAHRSLVSTAIRAALVQ